jgi:hypothetical protein
MCIPQAPQDSVGTLFRLFWKQKEEIKIRLIFIVKYRKLFHCVKYTLLVLLFLYTLSLD